MKSKYLLLVIATVAITKQGFAQYQQDALRYSTFTTGATARIRAVGNAGTAVGGDLSSVGGNPAGIGFFTKSELSLTPEFDGSKVNSTYFNNPMSNSKSNLNLNNAAFVIYSKLNTPKGADKTKGWLSLNFGFAYDRTNNYYENFSYSGKNNNNSINDYYAEDANSQVTPSTAATANLSSNSLGQWGYNEYLIDKYTVGSGVLYKSNALAGVNQLNNTVRTGGESEVNFSMGANYSNMLYFGVSLGISTLRYNNNSSFTETGTASVYQSTSNTFVNQPYSNVYSQYQDTKGTGVNAKFGVIFKPVNAVRLGLLITTPTHFAIDDSYSEGMATRIAASGTSPAINAKDGPASYPFSYTLNTPAKIAGGISVFVGKLGFITADAEYQDFSTMSVHGDYAGQTTDNNNIKTLYQSAVNLRAGAEARVTSNFFLRGGYGVQGNPEKYNGSDIKTTSGGIGYRSGVYYVDATYTHMSSNDTIYPYELANAGTISPGAALSRTKNNVYLTVGMRF